MDYIGEDFGNVTSEFEMEIQAYILDNTPSSDFAPDSFSELISLMTAPDGGVNASFDADFEADTNFDKGPERQIHGWSIPGDWDGDGVWDHQEFIYQVDSPTNPWDSGTAFFVPVNGGDATQFSYEVAYDDYAGNDHDGDEIEQREDELLNWLQVNIGGLYNDAIYVEYDQDRDVYVAVIPVV